MIPTERRQRITEVFQLAVKLRPEVRDNFLERECAGDDALLLDVKSLLSEDHSIGESSAGITPSPVAANPPAIPQRIGKYEISEEIGSGGFGHVYRAVDPTFDRVVAIKVLNAPDNVDIVRRFRAEAKTVANLHHKNIVTVHDFGEEAGVPYLVMEYLDGTTLQVLIHRNSLSLLEKVEVMSEVAAGLHYAHERGVTHRDIKPANIMRLTDGSVKIMDFGIARMAAQTGSRLTETGSVIGSLMYMAPEQFGGISDPVTDVFGYGVTFHELLTGQNPFSSSDPAIIIYKITNSDAPAVRSLVPECPEALDRLVRRALAKSRESRYASLSDVVADTRAVRADLRRDYAEKLCAEAGQLYWAGQLDAAKSQARKALDLDPVHAGARTLRSEIEESLRQREVAARARALVDSAELELRERRFEDAAVILVAVRQLESSDPQLKAWLDIAAAQIEQARRCATLLDVAREDLKNQNLTGAFRAVSEGLLLDPVNNAGGILLQEIRSHITARDKRRQLQEELSRAEGLLLVGDTDQALALLMEIGTRYPESSDVSTLLARAGVQMAQEERARRLADETAEARFLLGDGQIQQALAKIDSLLTEFDGNPDLQTLLSLATDALAVERRRTQIANLKLEAAGFIEQGAFDAAIGALEARAAAIGDESDLAGMMQVALAGKASQERERAVAAARSEADRLLQKSDGNAALVVLGQAAERNGDDLELQKLRDLALSQVRDCERSVRLKAIAEEIRRLAAAMQWEEAVQKVDEALSEFPDDPALTAEHESLLASRETARHEQAIGKLLAQIQVLRNGGRLAEAAELLLAGMRDLGQDARLIEARLQLAECLAQQQSTEDINKVYEEARALRSQGRIDQAIAVLEAGEVLYQSVPALVDLLVVLRSDRQKHLNQQETEQLPAQASEVEAADSIGTLEESVKSCPECRDPVEAGVDPGAAATAAKEEPPGAPPAIPNEPVRTRRAPWIGGGLLVVCGLLYGAARLNLIPHPGRFRDTPPTNILRIEQPAGPETATLGKSFSKALRSFGSALPVSWSAVRGPLPPGLVLNSQTGIIAGTPTTAGEFSFLSKASDNAGHHAEQRFTILVVDPRDAQPLRFESRHIEEIVPGCGDTKDGCAHANFTYVEAVSGPKIVRERINEAIRGYLMSLPRNGLKLTLEEYAKEWVRGYEQSQREKPKPGEGLFSGWTLSESVELLSMTPSIVTLERFRHYQVVGSHLRDDTSAMTFDALTGESVRLSSVLKEGALPRLNAIGEAHFLGAHGMALAAKLKEAGTLWFQLTNFGLGQEELFFYFDAYTVPPWEGSTKIGIPLAEVRDLLQPEVLSGGLERLPKEPEEVDIKPPSASIVSVPRTPSSPPRAGDVKVNPADGLRYVWIPPGKFQMGCSRCFGGLPEHPVTITKGFWIGQTEVTQEAYKRVVGTEPSLVIAAKLPVHNVGWDAAQGYCRAAGMRLPSEAEWEYSARAGAAVSNPGDLNWIRARDRVAWYSSNSGRKPHPVGKKEPNAWGLYDMTGNVAEWVSDWYDDQYQPGSMTDPEGPLGGTLRVLRGGGWDAVPPDISGGQREAGSPAYRGSEVGMRCAGNAESLANEPWPATEGARHQSPTEVEKRASSPSSTSAHSVNITKVNEWDGLTYVWIPPGIFQMGCSSGDGECVGTDRSVEVTITNGFWLGQTEVTQQAYERVVGTNPSYYKGVNLPVDTISWLDAQSYCQEIGMRLPTEAEWEYAVRGGNSGSRYGVLDQIAWYQGNSGEGPHEVGQKQPNAWGLYDMLGNVWEWVADWFGDKSLAKTRTNPKGPATGTFRTLRGGAWDFDASRARASYRVGDRPESRYRNFGVRCAGN